jgi:hypothetical protein
VHDTWAARELPVLDATVSLLEESYMVTVSDIATRTELEPAAVARALETLDPDYVDFRKTTTGGDPTFWYVLKVTPEARRAVGQWPTPDSFVTRLAGELSAAASQEEDAERKGLLSYAARLVGDTLREAVVRAAGQVLAPATGNPAAATPRPAAPGPASAAEPAAPGSPSAGPASAGPDSAGPDSAGAGPPAFRPTLLAAVKPGPADADEAGPSGTWPGTSASGTAPATPA